MKLDSILQILLPKDKKFFPLFEKASGNLVDISKALNDLVITESGEKRRELFKEIERLEHVGDAITHEIHYELSASFITPFDREDIHVLATALDDIADYVHGSSKRIDIYKLTELNPAIPRLAELIQKATQELHIAISQLKNMKNVRLIQEACVRINSIENHADDIFDNAIAQLFEYEKNAVEIIKVKEVLSALETATDKCEDAANVLESLLVKAT